MARKSISDHSSDEELISICNDGDANAASSAFVALYQRHKDFVIRVALRYVRDNEMALDVLQETFAYLLRKFPPAGPGLTMTARLSTLLYPVARSLAITQLRQADRHASDGSVDPDDLPSTGTAEASDIDPVLKRLPMERREVVLMRFVDDMSLQEIAAALEIPLGTVKSRLHLAIRQLREDPRLKKDYFS